jgi:glycosyltransferase involved in cell wall biosynthesis
MRKRKSKILVVGALPPPFNGMSVVFSTLCESVLTERYQFDILDISDNRDLSNVGKFDFVNVLLALKHGMVFLFRIISNRPNLVYLSIAQGTLGFIRDALFLIPSRIFGLPVIVHLHGSEFQKFFQGSSFAVKAIIKYSLNKVARAIVLGDSLIEQFDGLVPREKIVVVSNGIQTSSGQIERTVRKGVVCVAFLGSLKKRKGFLEIIQIIPKVIASEKNTIFRFAGEKCELGTYIEATSFLRENSLEKYVEFAGVVQGEEKYKFLDDADVFCFPPIEPEGQPLVIIEAMSRGLPVVSTPMGAIPDIVRDGVTGYIVESRNSEELAERIIRLVRNKSERETMGANAVKDFYRMYTEKHWIERLDQVINETIRE